MRRVEVHVSSQNPTRYFTPEEANAVLPDLVRQLKELTERARRARALAEEANRVEGGEPNARTRLEQLQRDVNERVAAIQAQGVLVKGTEPGLLDFPALKHGREVYLCWREGEERIEHWHPVHTGIAGRQDLDYGDLGAWEWEN